MRLRWLFIAALLAAGCSQTDAGVTASVKSRLVGDDRIQAGRIDVDTTNHVVTLSGEVRTSQEAVRAVQLARDTEGVTQVVNRLKVVPREEVPTSGAFGQGAPGTITPAPAPTRP